jgi:hypothetical protein
MSLPRKLCGRREGEPVFAARRINVAHHGAFEHENQLVISQDEAALIPETYAPN